MSNPVLDAARRSAAATANADPFKNGISINPTKHPEYKNNLFSWQRSEDCFGGQDKIMRNIHNYFATPPGLHSAELEASGIYTKSVEFLSDRIASGSGYGAAPKAYYAHAIFPPLTPFTINGFMALVTEHDALVELPEQLSHLFEDSKDLDDENRLFSKAIEAQIHLNVLLYGRCPVLIDPQEFDRKIKPAFIIYDATSIINWVTSNNQEDKGKLLEVMIEENIANPDHNLLNNNEKRTLKKYLHLYLDQNNNNIYTVDIYTEILKHKGKFTKETKVPNILGKELDYIPFLFIGSEDNTPSVDVSPLSGISVAQIKYGELEALLSHAENHSGAPTFVVSGVTKEDMPAVTGAGVGIALPDYTSKAYYTTTDTSFMVSVRERQLEFLSQAQDQGANLLGSNKNTSESGEALRLRQAASTATLKSIISNVGHGIETLLRIVASWLSLPMKDVSYTPNREFSTFALTANEQIALLQSWQGKAMSHSTLLHNFRKAGLLKPGETAEAELETLKLPGEMFIDTTEQTAEGGLDIGSGLPKSNTLDKNIK